MNNQTLNQIIFREQVIDGIRKFFKQQNFHEMFTDTMVPIPSCEPNLEPFKTELITATGKKSDRYLIMSPEFSLKKLMALGFDNIFEIAKVFRNGEEESAWHKPEFFMLEWYRRGADYTKIMSDFEDLFLFLNNGSKLTYQNKLYDLTKPWPRYSISDLFNNTIPENESDFFQFFLNNIEPKLKDSLKPAIIYDWPASMASLSRKKPTNPKFAERFEVYLAGIELCNAFSELTDPVEQRQRFTEEMQQRKNTGKSVYPLDEELLSALGKIDSMAGIAVGVDRLIMLLGNFINV